MTSSSNINQFKLTMSFFFLEGVQANTFTPILRPIADEQDTVFLNDGNLSNAFTIVVSTYI